MSSDVTNPTFSIRVWPKIENAYDSVATQFTCSINGQAFYRGFYKRILVLNIFTGQANYLNVKAEEACTRNTDSLWDAGNSFVHACAEDGHGGFWLVLRVPMSFNYMVCKATIDEKNKAAVVSKIFGRFVSVLPCMITLSYSYGRIFLLERSIHSSNPSGIAALDEDAFHFHRLTLTEEDINIRPMMGAVDMSTMSLLYTDGQQNHMKARKTYFESQRFEEILRWANVIGRRGDDFIVHFSGSYGTGFVGLLNWETAMWREIPVMLPSTSDVLVCNDYLVRICFGSQSINKYVVFISFYKWFITPKMEVPVLHGSRRKRHSIIDSLQNPTEENLERLSNLPDNMQSIFWYPCHTSKANQCYELQELITLISEIVRPLTVKGLTQHNSQPK